jgi:hypothetical protein
MLVERYFNFRRKKWYQKEAKKILKCKTLTIKIVWVECK